MGVHARTAVTPGDGSLHVEDLLLPDPAPYQVVVRLFASGICHSQLTDMKYAQAMSSPMTLGHEATGEIVAVGANVTTTGIGDRVFVTWLPRDGGPLRRRPDSPVLTRSDGSTATCHNVFTWTDHTICDELLMRLRRNGLAAAPRERTGNSCRDGGPLRRRPDSPVLTRSDGSTATCHNVFTWTDHTICDEPLMRLRRNGLAAAAGTNL